MYNSQRQLGFLEFVPDRTQDALLSIIEISVLPGTEIHSDQWAAYRAIPALPVIPPNRHLTVNHSETFLASLTGAHTNNVESFWKNEKQVQFATTELAIAYLQNRQIIAQNPPNCSTIGCNRPMTLIKQSSTIDGVIWAISISQGLQEVHLGRIFLEWAANTFKIFLMLAFYWAYSVSVGIATEAKVSKVTAIQWYQHFRDICSRLTNVSVLNLSTVSDKWFGSSFRNVHCQRQLGFLEFVPDRTQDTLLSIIEISVLPGTEIHSDQWAAYRAIPALPVIPPNRHLTVNHSETFVASLTGAHTNNAECFWKNAKLVKEMSGTCDAHLSSYMDELMWRQLNGKKTQNAFDN
ncbi:hypothetical protein ANN_26549 [Periplaneta americana]|uniref:ISXO2-like transposase domain-containing protein n=1 Tax=Periplaneta americana TaxID=6978 RepID=A0ABQ8RYW5_PERAM|nr:hypothetical protein ANN_26549 [Periplaneta americana]